MKFAATYRLLLALCVAVLSTASTLHEVGHTLHSNDIHHAAYASTDTHSEHPGDCQFCAKGPTTSTEALRIDVVLLTACTRIALPLAKPDFQPSLLRHELLRGPPIA